MDLALIRHAEPDRPDSPEGRLDPGLSALGRAQASAVADRLRCESWDALYTSPQRRAVETAEVVGGGVRLEPRVDRGLAEFDYGKTYVPLEDLMAVGNAQMAAFRREDFSAYGTDAATIRRNAVTTLDGIIAAHPGQRVIVVTHGAVINGFVGAFLGSKRLVFHHPSYTGVTEVLASRRGPREFRRLNDSTHLRLPRQALIDREFA